MNIWSYTPVSCDDTDVLPSCLNSLSKIPVDRMIVADGGLGRVLVARMRNWTPVSEWLKTRPEYKDGLWNGVPLELIHNPQIHPAQQRNDVLRWIDGQPIPPDWIIALDSDEIASDEMIVQCRPLLSQAPDRVTNYVQPLLNIAQDEAHCAGGVHSGWLSHARVHRRGVVRYRGEWHEHQDYSGVRERWPARIVHTRMLFRKRLLYQRDAPTITGSWPDAVIGDIPEGVHWTLEWPTDEKAIPFYSDAREYFGE